MDRDPLDRDPLNRDSLVNRITYRSKNITLPPTLFVGGNNRLDNYLGEGGTTRLGILDPPLVSVTA